ncbi:alpha/beta hydrolase domain-containing protein [Thraustotheca clavata]|uniref:Alpha/beta hydrolase domain-containing protein n=1 Tax=Thraustotheca clavata TaxID=74557 RepID=A0A1V9ZE86_9STRA|nr:alpha/beta hydrolase domain-containing protein [Thraustotheca clavata]
MLLHYGGKECFKDDCDKMVQVLQSHQVDLTVATEPLALHVSPLLHKYFGEMSAHDNWREHLTPLPRASRFRIYANFFYLVLKSCGLRLLGKYYPLVDGWSMSTSLMLQFIVSVLDNDRNTTRAMLNSSAKLINLLIKGKPVFYQGEGFCGYWFGKELTSDTDPIILYTHGGGFTLCTAQSYLGGIADIQACLSKKYGVNARVFSVEYTLAPEAKFPTQISEVVAAYEYVSSQFPNNPILLMGDSAGGNLVLTNLLSLKAKEDIRRPSAAILISPWVTASVTEFPPSYAECEANDIVHIRHLKHHLDAYLPEDATDEIFKNPLISPIYGDFTGCCPMLLHYGGKECFKDDCEKMAKVLKSQQVDVTVAIEPLAPHISPLFRRFFGDMSVRGCEVIAEFIAAVCRP